MRWRTRSGGTDSAPDAADPQLNTAQEDRARANAMGMRTRSWRVGAGLAIFLAGLGYGFRGMAAETCLKLVFNQYCLGGEVNVLVQQRPAFSFQQRQEDRFAVVYPDGRESVYVLSFRGRIYKVLRKFASATILKYDEMLDLLNAKYGRSQDLSRFPAYVRSDASKIGAIRRGDGRAMHRWQPAGQAWSLTLTWTRELGLAVAYVADELAAAQEAAAAEGF